MIRSMLLPFSSMVMFACTHSLLLSMEAQQQVDARRESLSQNISITLELWPSELIVSGSVFYVVFYANNHTPWPAVVSASDLFVRNDVENNSTDGVPVASLWGGRDWICGSLNHYDNVRYGMVVVPAGGRKVVHIDRFPCHVPRLEQGQAGNFMIRNFRECFQRNLVNPNNVVLVKPPKNKADDDLFNLHFGQFSEFYFASPIESSIGPLNVQLLLCIGHPNVGLDYKTWQDWKLKEDSYSEGTFKDELRLTRILFQYAETEEVAVLNEIQDWFAELPEIQRVSFSHTLRGLFPDGITYDTEKPFEPDDRSLYARRVQKIYERIMQYDTLPKTAREIQYMKYLGLLDQNHSMTPIFRLWQANNKSYSIVAKYVSATNTKVVLEKEDGEKIDVDLIRLSDADQKYVQQRIEEFEDTRKMRPWSSTGVAVNARLMHVDGDIIFIEKDDGEIGRCSFKHLSSKDQRYIKEQVKLKGSSEKK